MTKISPKQGNEVIGIFSQDINGVISVFIKSDNYERLSNLSNIHHSCCKRDIQKCKRKLCSGLLSSFPGLLGCTSRLEELLFSPFQLGCRREVGPAEHRIWALRHWGVYTVTDQCFPDGKLVRDQEGILAPGFIQQKSWLWPEWLAREPSKECFLGIGILIFQFQLLTMWNSWQSCCFWEDSGAGHALGPAHV